MDPRSHRWLLIVCALWVLGMAAWTSGFPWVFDDRALVDPDVLPDISTSLAIAWTEDFWYLAAEEAVQDSGMYRPLVHTTYILERALAGGSPALGHAVNAALHGLVALLAALLALRLGGAPWLAFLPVLVHPYAAEAVANVTARTDPMAAMFLLAALLVALPSWRAGAALRWRAEAAAAALVCAACLSKEVAFVAPALFAVVAWVRGVGGRELARSAAPAIVGAAVALVARAVALSGGLPEGPGVDPIGAVASMGWAVLDIVVPAEPRIGPWPPERPPLPGLVALAASLALAAAAASTGRKAIAGAVLWALIAWTPMADWMGVGVRPSRALIYVPLVGFSVLMAVAAGTVSAAARQRVVAVVATLGVVLAIAQLRAIALWDSDRGLWERAVIANPESPLPRINYARAQAEAGRPEVARAVYEDAARLAREQGNPGLYEIATTSLAMLALQEGDLIGARAWYERTLAAVGPERSPTAVRGLEAVSLLEQRKNRPYTPPALDPAPLAPVDP